MASKVTHKLDWRGAALRSQVVETVVAGVQEFGLTHERRAKGKLYKGHGVLTGTLRRSIHADEIGADFGGSDSEGGQLPNVSEKDGAVGVAVGSGLVYAGRIEELYGYMAESHVETLPELPGILEKHAAKRGLK